MTSVRVHYTIKDDNIVEDDETFSLIIDPSSLPRSVSIGNPGEATVTIVDDDRE